MKTMITVSLHKGYSTYSSSEFGELEVGPDDDLMDCVNTCVKLGQRMTAKDGYRRSVVIEISKAEEPCPELEPDLPAVEAEEVVPA